MTPGDAVAIGKLPAITAVAPHQDIEGIVVSAGRQKANTWLVGMTPTYAQIHNRAVRSGRQISPSDVSFGRSVIVLGSVARERLFPHGSSLGKTVRVGSHEFEVVGTLERRGSLGGNNLDNQIFIPLPIATRVLLGGINTRSIDVRLRSGGGGEGAGDSIGTPPRRPHRPPAPQSGDFSVQEQRRAPQ